jgi:hypothetical protein
MTCWQLELITKSAKPEQEAWLFYETAANYKSGDIKASETHWEPPITRWAQLSRYGGRSFYTHKR